MQAALCLLLTSLLASHTDLASSQDSAPKSRSELTQELEELTRRFEEFVEKSSNSGDVEKTVEKLGATLGENLTQAVSRLGARQTEVLAKLGEQQEKGLEKLGEKLGTALGDRLAEAIKKFGEAQASAVGRELSGKVDELKESGDALAKSVGTLADKVDASSVKLDQVGAAGESLKTKVDQLQTSGNKLAAGLEAVAGEVEENSGRLAVVAETSKRLTQDLAEMDDQLTKKVGANAERLDELSAAQRMLSTALVNIQQAGGGASDLDAVYKPTSCADVKVYDKDDGAHTLTVNNKSIQVYCEQTSGPGGWAVIQRRVDGKVDFYRNWADYKTGFGSLEHEFWLGLDSIYQLTSSGKHSLRVDLQDWDNSTAYAEYEDFSIGSADVDFPLHISGYSGDAGDGMVAHHDLNTMRFSTIDRDNDARADACTRVCHGAWWYNDCTFANPNGRYILDGRVSYEGIYWFYWKNDYRSLKTVEMKIRRRA